MNQATRGWGVEVTRVEIKDIEPSPDIIKAMELQMSAERHKRATVWYAEYTEYMKLRSERTQLMLFISNRMSFLIEIY